MDEVHCSAHFVGARTPETAQGMGIGRCSINLWGIRFMEYCAGTQRRKEANIHHCYGKITGDILNEK